MAQGGGISVFIGTRGGATVIAVAAIAAAVALTHVITGGGGAQSCTGADVNGSAALATRIGTASNGDTLCLLNGSYGTFAGTNKAITIAAKTGQTSVSMAISFGSGDSGFTLDGVIGVHGDIGGGASNITITNATFDHPGTTGSSVTVSGTTTSGITISNSDLTFTGVSTGNASKIETDGVTGTVASPALTIDGNNFANSDYDGVAMGGNDTSGIVITDNKFIDFCDLGANHTDAIQWIDIDPGADNMLVARNWIRAFCDTQGITSYDAGTAGVTIEDNVVDTNGRGNAIEIYGDGSNGSPSPGTSGPNGSIVRHNTLPYYAPSGGGCHENPVGCGGILFKSKLTGGIGGNDPAGCCSLVYDNIATDVEVISGEATITRGDHNGCRVASPCASAGGGSNTTGVVPVYVGGSNTSTFTSRCDYALASGSPGENAASDGLDMGITGC